MRPNAATIIGSPVSPYVRKVLAVCEMKGIAYRLDPIVPFFGDDRFSDLSPLRRVPVFVDDKLSLCDSTAICEYLEERYPAPRLLPVELAQRQIGADAAEFAAGRVGGSRRSADRCHDGCGEAPSQHHGRGRLGKQKSARRYAQLAPIMHPSLPSAFPMAYCKFLPVGAVRNPSTRRFRENNARLSSMPGLISSIAVSR